MNQHKSYLRSKVTPEKLHRISLNYLNRFSASCESLRRVLKRHVLKSSLPSRSVSEADYLVVEEVIEKLKCSGLLDDIKFAEGRLYSLRRLGSSTRKIKSRLLEKGVDAVIIEDLFSLELRDNEDPDLYSAVRLAKRKKLGVSYSSTKSTYNRRDKDLSILARAGFCYKIIYFC